MRRCPYAGCTKSATKIYRSTRRNVLKGSLSSNILWERPFYSSNISSKLRENAKWRERSKLRSEIVEGKSISYRLRNSPGFPFGLAGAASASTGGPATDVQAQNFSPSHEVFLGEGEREYRRELGDVLCFRQGKHRETSDGRKARLVARLRRLPIRRLPLRLASRLCRLRSLRPLRSRVVLVQGWLPRLLDRSALRQRQQTRSA